MQLSKHYVIINDSLWTETGQELENLSIFQHPETKQ